ncbi:MAG: type II toxin-antitoxin system VapC family toxin [Planctomycetaceae bacterium]|nr:type II toxin-antitoxin system VapC family toxin [Planctomycetaceae bacterium]
MKPRVYIETSIPSFYHDRRTASEIIVRRAWTRKWWQTAADRFEMVTSVAVLDEIIGENEQQTALRQELMLGVDLLPIDEAIAEIAQFYIEHKLMPSDPSGDALHLAIASYHKCDFLLTWNCRHLANANKFGHIRRLNSLLGLYCSRTGDAIGASGRY